MKPAVTRAKAYLKVRHKAVRDAMKELNKKYDPVTYAGAGHGFMRGGEPINPPPAAAAAGADEAAAKKAADAMTMYKANRKAHDDAWTRWMSILAKL